MNKNLAPEQQRQLDWATQNMRLEGYEPSGEAKRDAKAILRGEKTVEKAVQEVIRKHTHVR